MGPQRSARLSRDPGNGRHHFRCDDSNISGSREEPPNEGQRCWTLDHYMDTVGEYTIGVTYADKPEGRYEMCVWVRCGAWAVFCGSCDFDAVYHAHFALPIARQRKYRNW